MTRRPFGSLAGSDVELYTLRAGQIELTAITLGGIITSLRVPDRDGRPGDVVLGHDRLEPYIDNRAYLGAIVGRYANRIAHGRFTLDGVDYQLAKNNGRHHLHGGICGFDRHIWHATAATTDHTASITFERVSPAGEEGYPGTLHAAVTYRVATGNIVTLRYEAETDAPTIVNLTQHTYFNLGGESSASILDHELTIRARSFLPVDSGLIPLATSTPVEGSCFDFTNPAPIGSRLGATDDQLRTAGGFDHNFILAHHSGTTIVAAELRDPSSRRLLTITTTEPGLQFYDGHLLDGSTGAYGRVFRPHAGLCLETQHFPDTPNRPDFPSVVLRPGERSVSTTIWMFGLS